MDSDTLESRWFWLLTAWSISNSFSSVITKTGYVPSAIWRRIKWLAIVSQTCKLMSGHDSGTTSRGWSWDSPSELDTCSVEASFLMLRQIFCHIISLILFRNWGSAHFFLIRSRSISDETKIFKFLVNLPDFDSVNFKHFCYNCITFALLLRVISVFRSISII